MPLPEDRYYDLAKAAFDVSYILPPRAALDALYDLLIAQDKTASTTAEAEAVTAAARVEIEQARVIRDRAQALRASVNVVRQEQRVAAVAAARALGRRWTQADPPLVEPTPPPTPPPPDPIVGPVPPAAGEPPPPIPDLPAG